MHSIPAEPARPTHAFNLFGFRPVRALVRWRGFPGVFQLMVLAVFVALAVIGWGHFTPAGVNAKLYAKTNLVNLAIWGLWWPIIIWVTFLLGRAWCIVCPLELVSAKAEQLGRLTGLRQSALGGWLAKGSVALLIFAALQMLVPGVQLHRVPHYTSLFLWGSLGLAGIVGLLFRNRAFCRGFCPVSLLLSAYGRGGMLAVRPAGGGCCKNGHAAPDARACPSLLNPAQLNTSKDCLLCSQCVKADSHGAMQLLVRLPFARSDIREPLASWPLTLFVMIVSGFVTYELAGVWKTADQLFAFVPEQIAKALHATALGGWIKGLWTIAVVPLLLWLVLGGIARLLGAGQSLGEAWRRLALPMAVVVATGHMAKGLEKFTSWAGFLPFAWTEPTGVTTALRMTAKTIPQPGAWLTAPSLSLAGMLLIAAGTWLALREARLADSEKARTRFLPIVLLGGFYFFLVFGWSGWVK